MDDQVACRFCGATLAGRLMCDTLELARSCAHFDVTGKIGEVIKDMTAAVLTRLDETRRQESNARLLALKNEIDDATTAITRINAIVEQLLAERDK